MLLIRAVVNICLLLFLVAISSSEAEQLTSELYNQYQASRAKISSSAMVTKVADSSALSKAYEAIISGKGLSGSAGELYTLHRIGTLDVYKPVGAVKGFPAMALRSSLRSKRPKILQVPHSFFDRHTGEIGLQLFENGFADMIMWNTVHRKFLDVCHDEPSAFQTLTRVLGEAGDPLVVQLHGFNKAKDVKKSRSFDVIVSSGSSMPTPVAKKVVTCLSESQPTLEIGLYGESAKTLGATTNLQGRLLRTLGRGSFLHIELSRELRNLMLNNHSLRDSFKQCLEKL